MELRAPRPSSPTFVLEEHKLIERIVHNRTPVLIEYKLRPHAESLRGVLKALKEWGLEHRKVVMGK